MRFPCKDCPKRYPGCHDKCPEYQEAKSKNDAAREAEHARKQREAYTIDTIRDRRARMAKKRRGRSGVYKFER